MINKKIILLTFIIHYGNSVCLNLEQLPKAYTARPDTLKKKSENRKRRTYSEKKHEQLEIFLKKCKNVLEIYKSPKTDLNSETSFKPEESFVIDTPVGLVSALFTGYNSNSQEYTNSQEKEDELSNRARITNIVKASFLKKFIKLLNQHKNISIDQLKKHISTALNTANNDIMNEFKFNDITNKKKSFGVEVSMFIHCNNYDKIVTVNIGRIPILRYRNGAFEKLSEPHTPHNFKERERLKENRFKIDKEKGTSLFAGKLFNTRSIGDEACNTDSKPSIKTHTIRPGDILLILSNSIADAISRKKMLKIIHSHRKIWEAKANELKEKPLWFDTSFLKGKYTSYLTYLTESFLLYANTKKNNYFTNSLPGSSNDLRKKMALRKKMKEIEDFHIKIMDIKTKIQELINAKKTLGMLLKISLALETTKTGDERTALVQDVNLQNNVVKLSNAHRILAPLAKQYTYLKSESLQKLITTQNTLHAIIYLTEALRKANAEISNLVEKLDPKQSLVSFTGNIFNSIKTLLDTASPHLKNNEKNLLQIEQQLYGVTLILSNELKAKQTKAAKTAIIQNFNLKQKLTDKVFTIIRGVIDKQYQYIKEEIFTQKELREINSNMQKTLNKMNVEQNTIFQNFSKQSHPITVTNEVLNAIRDATITKKLLTETYPYLKADEKIPTQKKLRHNILKGEIDSISKSLNECLRKGAPTNQSAIIGIVAKQYPYF